MLTSLIMHYNVRHLVLSLGNTQTLASQLDCSTPLDSKLSFYALVIYRGLDYSLHGTLSLIQYN